VQYLDWHQDFEVVCDEHGIRGGGGECCGDNNAQLDRINLLFHEA
jgi:hypothetical protein